MQNKEEIYYQKLKNENANITPEEYVNFCNLAKENNDKFWDLIAKDIFWHEKYKKVNASYFKKNDVKIDWFKDGKLNITYNCVDRHVKTDPQRTAFIWQGEDDNQIEYISYQALYENMCKFANMLKDQGIKKGDRVIIYMPMIPLSIYAMLACARIGAVHSVVFGGFSAESLANRMDDCKAKLVITSDYVKRGGKYIPLLKNVNDALDINSAKNTVTKILYTKLKKDDIAFSQNMAKDQYIYIDAHINNFEDTCPCEIMDSSDPLFILYTSGSTGKPKGLLHNVAGYLVHVHYSFKLVFDYKKEQIFWCTADIGWITGHSYLVYGPLSNGATSFIYESLPNYPDASRCWELIDKHKINIFYTAPTAIRALMREGNEYVTKYKRDSLKLLGTVGEPINPEAWKWYYEIVGNSKCPIIDSWWQTETGGIMISPLVAVHDLFPGSATKQLPGIFPALLDKDGNEIQGVASGNLVMKTSWPGQAVSIYNDHDRFVDTYFSTYPGYYFTGDGAKRDEHGNYWITGRVDDVLNISGHRIGTAEVESSLVLHEDIAEAAVVGCTHDIKGQALYCYVTPNKNVLGDDELRKKLVQLVRKEIGPIATPDYIQFCDALPKTRSGKIMRRILRKIAAGEINDLGDVSTLADANIIKDLISGKIN